MVLVVQGVDGRHGIGVAPHLDEAEPAAPARLPVDDYLRASHFAEWDEQFFQLGIANREREIANIQLLAHLQAPSDLSGMRPVHPHSEFIQRTQHRKFNRAHSELKPRPVSRIDFSRVVPKALPCRTRRLEKGSHHGRRPKAHRTSAVSSGSVPK